MKLKILAYIFVLILLVGFVQAQSYTLSGTVTGEGVGLLTGASVQAWDLTETIKYCDVQTGTNGFYPNCNLGFDTGSAVRTIIISHPQYNTLKWQHIFSGSETHDFILGPILSLTLTGTVTDINGPLVNALITVKRLGSTVATAYTILGGTYAINGLENQVSYDVTASKIGYQSNIKSITMNGNSQLNFFLAQESVTCTDADADNYYLEGSICGTLADCNDSNPNINPGQTEVCDGGIDNDCNPLTTESSCNCINGQQKICGTNIGICQYGTQTCSNGQWGSCTGSINPVSEVCGDNLDNDCDGLTDEICYPPFDNEIYVEKSPKTVNLAVNEAVKLHILDQIRYTTLKVLSPYYISLDIQSDFAIPGVPSVPLKISIQPNAPEEIDLTRDGKSDLVVTYEGVESNEAKVSFSLPEIKATTSEEKTEKRTASSPSTSIIDYFQETISIPLEKVKTFRIVKNEYQEVLAAAFILFLFMLASIMHLAKRKWNQWQ